MLVLVLVLEPVLVRVTVDPMAMAEKQVGKTAGGPSFVKAKLQLAPPQDHDNAPASAPVHEANVEEIQMSEDED
jgi:hypothetical protein